MRGRRAASLRGNIERSLSDHAETLYIFGKSSILLDCFLVSLGSIRKKGTVEIG